jgi:hypothetical protein
MGNTGGHDGNDGNNILPLVFDGEKLPEQWFAFSGDNSGYHIYRQGEDPQMKNEQSEHFFVPHYHLFRCNTMIMIGTRSLCIAMQFLLETSSKEKPCHLNGLLKPFLCSFFLPNFN